MRDGTSARAAAARAAASLVEPGMTIGLGSGGTVWIIVELLRERGVAPRVVPASERTERFARRAGMEIVELAEGTEIALALDGADEIDPELRLVKGGGGALLREKVLASAARRFVVAADARRCVERLGERAPLPVEVVRFGAGHVRRELGRLLDQVSLRMERGRPYVTEQGNWIVEGGVPEGSDPVVLDRELNAVPGVVEHGLFIGLVDRVLLGYPDGAVETLKPP